MANQQWVVGSFVATFILIQTLFSVAAQAATYTVRSTEIPEFIQLQGLVEATKQATVSAQVSGRVNEVTVDVGDNVPAGTTILTITALEHDHLVAQAQAEVSAWQATFHAEEQELARISSLVERELASVAELDRAQARYDHAKAQLRGAQAALARSQEQLSYTEVKAPYSGIVSARWVEPGELVQPGTPLLSGFAPTELRIHVDLPATYARSANTYQRAAVDGVEPNRMIIFPTVDSASGTVRVRLELAADSEFMPGQWVPVQIQVAAHEGLLIPRAAVQRQGELYLVRVQDHGWRAVRIGAVTGEMVEVMSGVAVGEVIEYEP